MIINRANQYRITFNGESLEVEATWVPHRSQTLLDPAEGGYWEIEQVFLVEDQKRTELPNSFIDENDDGLQEALNESSSQDDDEGRDF